VATDSIDAKSGVIQFFELFDLDGKSKIPMQQAYGDFTGLMIYLNGQEHGT
jgi:hypothetical protein